MHPSCGFDQGTANQGGLILLWDIPFGNFYNTNTQPVEAGGVEGNSPREFLCGRVAIKFETAVLSFPDRKIEIEFFGSGAPVILVQGGSGIAAGWRPSFRFVGGPPKP